MDSDGDSLDNLREMIEGTDPFIADSDGDGVPDGTEVEAGSDPLDQHDSRPAPPEQQAEIQLTGYKNIYILYNVQYNIYAHPFQLETIVAATLKGGSCMWEQRTSRMMFGAQWFQPITPLGPASMISSWSTWTQILAKTMTVMETWIISAITGAQSAALTMTIQHRCPKLEGTQQLQLRTMKVNLHYCTLSGCLNDQWNVFRSLTDMW